MDEQRKYAILFAATIPLLIPRTEYASCPLVIGLRLGLF
jgi:hypothetical protein